ncbi:hypothetical protein [Bifidobacterium platyrrhinorum]|uniref:Uncharacterized protein n=1 Tax=Bifidobacterium platyrrhinorum TaxID=2661628 RepID=A0A6L9STS3_9BIFI|nr:hypothetical protein [Bifidobacterium platyrrhinorum]NEG55415.1 hypothetical protein [Bifidobacterium platyrrhinorum]
MRERPSFDNIAFNKTVRVVQRHAGRKVREFNAQPIVGDWNEDGLQVTFKPVSTRASNGTLYLDD